MISKLKKNLWSSLCVFWALVVSLFWFSMRVIWSGISKVIAEFVGAKEPTAFMLNLPLFVSIFLWILLAAAVANLALGKGKKWSKITLTAVLAVFTVASTVVVVMGAVDYLYFIIPKFFTSLGVSIGIILFALLLFFPPVKNCPLCTSLKWICIVLVILTCVFWGYDVTLGSRFTHEAVVYAVEDTYQIVFSTNHAATAWVEVDGQRYYDLFGGSMKSQDKVHKIVVPQQALDAAGGYSIHAEKMIYRGPFGGYLGDLLTEEYAFRPVDTSDGLNYYALSDVHEAVEAAA